MNDQKNKRKLFSEFSPVTTKQWEEKIQEDLKGSDYDKKLVWHTNEGFNVQPYYREEHLKVKHYLDVLPGEYPYTRGNKTLSNDWEIRQDIKLDNIVEANKRSLFLLERGITSLGYICPNVNGKSPLIKQEDFSQLLKDIYFDNIGLYFFCGHQAPGILSMLQKEVKLRKIDKNSINGAVDFDPLGFLTITGNYKVDEKTDFQTLQEIIKSAEKNLPNYRVLAINGHFLHNGGASAVQELGYSLAMATEYLTKLTDSGVPIDIISRHLQFNFGVGSNYFMEIAKIRAARTLWAKVIEAYHPNEEKSKQAYIHSVTSDWNQTVYDPYMNVLRATTESMAAVIGGTNSLSVRPFTSSYQDTSSFSGRVARNIQIILKEEAYLGKIVDPASGSYYIENLTDSIINEAWKIFLTVEKEGGYTEALKKGIVQVDIGKTSNNRDFQITTRREILVGTNQYPNTGETIMDEVIDEIAFPQLLSNIGDVKPIKIYRGATAFEKLRLATEKHSYRPKVFLLPIGNLTMRKARAAFSLNFFGCAGYEIIDGPGYSKADEGVKEALDCKADIIVVCSSDDEYTELVPQVNKLVGSKALIVVAGAPKCMEELKSKGIKYFIHLKSNMLETIEKFHQQLGIKELEKP
jgi:methylmalonyl-CoA mutase